LTPERKEVLRLYRAGLSVRQMALALDVSTQRIYQQLKRLKEGNHVEATSDTAE